MQPTHVNMFALKNSGLDTFLHADVGTELNGSALTILSMVARLGGDPWEQAAKWSKLPKAVVIDSLAQGIAQMPLASSALAETRGTAARLALLLPAQAEGKRRGGAEPVGYSVTPGQIYVVILYCAFVAGMALNLSLTPKPPGLAAAPTQQASGAEAIGLEVQAEGGKGAGVRSNAAEASAKRILGKAVASPGTLPHFVRTSRQARLRRAIAATPPCGTSGMVLHVWAGGGRGEVQLPTPMAEGTWEHGGGLCPAAAIE